MEIIRDGENGLLVPYNDLPKLKKAIDLILNDKELARKLATEGQITVRSYSSDRMVSELVRELSLSNKSL